MRAIWLAAVAVQLGFAPPLFAQNPSDTNLAIREKLPLFAKNHCETHKRPHACAG